MNDAVEGQVNGFYDEIDVIYHDDVAEQIDFYYNMFEDIYKRAEALNGDYGEKYKSYPQRLVKISSKLTAMFPGLRAALKTICWR